MVVVMDQDLKENQNQVLKNLSNKKGLSFWGMSILFKGSPFLFLEVIFTK